MNQVKLVKKSFINPHSLIVRIHQPSSSLSRNYMAVPYDMMGKNASSNQDSSFNGTVTTNKLFDEPTWIFLFPWT